MPAAAPAALVAFAALTPGKPFFPQPVEAAPPGEPRELAAQAGDTQVTLSWLPPDPGDGPAATSYDVYVAPTENYQDGTLAQTATGTGAVVHGLTDGSTYYFWVTAVNAAGQGPDSRFASAIPAATTPGAPGELTASPGNGQVTLSWTAPDSVVTDYDVYDATTEDYQDGTLAQTSIGTSTVVDNLTNGSTYYFWVTAVNAAGPGPDSRFASAIPAAAVSSVPGPPTALKAAADGSQVTLSWTAPASGGGTVTGYFIYTGNSPSAEPSTQLNDSPVTSTSYLVPDLTKGTTYFFTVTAVNAAGQGPPSGEATVALASGTGPGSGGGTVSGTTTSFAAPSRLTATAGNAEVALSWSAPASDGGSAVTGYKVDRATAPGSAASAVVTSVTGTSTTVTGLTNGTTYYFTIAAINAAGRESPFSAGVPARPGTRLTSGAWPKPLIAGLAAVAVVALAAAVTLATRGRRPGSQAGQQEIPTFDVRARPAHDRPGVVSVRDTGREPTHTVRLEPDRGTTTTTIKEKP